MAAVDLTTEQTGGITAAEQALLEKYSNFLTGTHAYTVDSKGRVNIPADFRKQLGENFCICPSFDFTAVALYSTLAWAKLREGYEQMGRFNRSLNRYLEQFDALTYRNQECDMQGRVLLPAKIRKFILSDARDVEVVGSNDHVSIRMAAKEEERQADFMAGLDGILDDIYLMHQQIGKENP